MKQHQHRIEFLASRRESVRAFYHTVAANQKLHPEKEGAMAGKQELAALAATIFDDDIKPWLKGADELSLKELAGADYSDANVGVLSGTLVAQGVLDVLAYQDPALSKVVQDFSEEGATLNQGITTRINVLPPTMAFDTTVVNGVENGWSQITAPQSLDVPYSLNQLVGIPLRFGLDIISGTVRRLSEEFIPAAALALSNKLMSIAYGLMTPANFNAYAAANPPTIPVAYATYPVALQDFGRATLTAVEGIFDNLKVPQRNRTMLMSQPFSGQLGKDPSIEVFYGGAQNPEPIETGEFPLVATWLPVKAAQLTAANTTPKLGAFAMQRNAIVLGCRPTTDLYDTMPGAGSKMAASGSSILVTNPRTRMTVMLVQYVSFDHTFAEWRIQAAIGGAVGYANCGLCITTP